MPQLPKNPEPKGSDKDRSMIQDNVNGRDSVLRVDAPGQLDGAADGQGKRGPPFRDALDGEISVVGLFDAVVEGGEETASCATWVEGELEFVGSYWWDGCVRWSGSVLVHRGVRRR